jgi:hypothetical protein
LQREGVHLDGRGVDALVSEVVVVVVVVVVVRNTSSMILKVLVKD